MRIFLAFILCLLCVSTRALESNATAIVRGRLTSNMDGNSKSITNLSSVSFPSQSGNGTLWRQLAPADDSMVISNGPGGYMVLSNAGDLRISGAYYGSGVGLTDLNASELTSGTVDDARLSTHVALTNRANTFYNVQTVLGAGKLTIGNNPAGSEPAIYGQGNILKEIYGASGFTAYDSGFVPILSYDPTEKFVRVRSQGGGGRLAFDDGTATNKAAPYFTFGTSYGDFPLGSASGMHDLPQAGPEIWRRCPKPLVIFEPYYAHTDGAGWNWTTASNVVYSFGLTGIGPFFQAFGIQPAQNFSSWRWTNSSGSTLAARDSSGKMWWNTNLFGTDFPALIRYHHNNGFGVILQTYAGLQSEYDVNNGSFSQTLMPPALTEWDIRQMVSWGMGGWTNVDVLRIAPGSGVENFGSERQAYRAVADAVLHPNWRVAIPFQGSGINLAAFGTNNLAVSWEKHGPTDYEQMRSVNGLVFDSNQSAPSPLGVDIENTMYALRYTYTNLSMMSGKGHFAAVRMPTDFNVSALEDIRADFGSAVIFPNHMQMGGHIDSTGFINLPGNFINAFTNTYWLQCYGDELQTPGVPLYDAGRNGSSCWAKPLAGGRFAVLCANETGGSVSLGTKLTAIRSPMNYMPPLGSPLTSWSFPSNQLANIYDVWNKSDLGTATDSFSNSIPAHSTRLYLVTPITNAVLSLSSAGVIDATNKIASWSSAAGLQFEDRVNSTFVGQWYASSDVARLYGSRQGDDVLLVGLGNGNLNVTAKLGSFVGNGSGLTNVSRYAAFPQAASAFSSGTHHYMGFGGLESTVSTNVSGYVSEVPCVISNAVFVLNTLGAGTNFVAILLTNEVRSSYSNSVNGAGAGGAAPTTMTISGAFTIPAGARGSWEVFGNNASAYAGNVSIRQTMYDPNR